MRLSAVRCVCVCVSLCACVRVSSSGRGNSCDLDSGEQRTFSTVNRSEAQTVHVKGGRFVLQHWIRGDLMCFFDFWSKNSVDASLQKACKGINECSKLQGDPGEKPDPCLQENRQKLHTNSFKTMMLMFCIGQIRVQVSIQSRLCGWICSFAKSTCQKFAVWMRCKQVFSTFYCRDLFSLWHFMLIGLKKPH